ncbi:hypothetical protein CJ030_MR4G020677 [Morella rubra]|uniref:Myb/SANT-like domain-containing protein n=1 Tax=Morella rubra TaxID=262757 RepID=A0A6A1VT61_9ROSI|nr:hypothetical protein CJ030_MR4G020676 [Morella rubra]KAB1216110.1 hypothetical protein CJ030_MR4G020677 [Morella rubra]
MDSEGVHELWNVSIKRELVSMLVEFKEAGLLVKGKCTMNTWTSIVGSMTQNKGKEYKAVSIRSKVARLWKEVVDFTTLLATGGFHWDAMSNTITALDET